MLFSLQSVIALTVSPSKLEQIPCQMPRHMGLQVCVGDHVAVSAESESTAGRINTPWIFEVEELYSTSEVTVSPLSVIYANSFPTKLPIGVLVR